MFHKCLFVSIFLCIIYSHSSVADGQVNIVNHVIDSEQNLTTFNSSLSNERTLIILKPDSVQRRLIGRIIQRFEDKGLKLVALKFVRASKELVEQHYIQHANETFYPQVIKFMSSSPIVPMVWEGLNAVRITRKMLGKSRPDPSTPGTIRSDFGIHIERNVIHGAHSVDEAKREINLWFHKNELIDWHASNTEWIYL